jgi:hypothetical protein
VGSPCVERLSHSGPQSSMSAAPRCLRCRQAGHRPMLLSESMPAHSRYRACEHGIDLSGNAPEDMEDVAARTQSCSPAHHSAELVPTSHSLTLHTRPVIPQSSRSQGDRIPLGAGSSDSHHLFSSVRHRRAQLSMTDAADLPVPPWPRSARM